VVGHFVLMLATTLALGGLASPAEIKPTLHRRIMEARASEQTAGQSATEQLEAKPSSEASDEGDVSVPTEPPVTLTVLQKFVVLRGLNASDKLQHRAAKQAAPSKLTAALLSRTYTKRQHGQKTEAQRAALREPVDVFSDSVDAYVPRKKKQELVNLHKDEQEVNDVFLTETRALLYEREVLDKVVCDREANRDEYEDKLWRLRVEDRGLQEAQEANGHTSEEHRQKLDPEQHTAEKDMAEQIERQQ
jgi:hypothetical protein